MRHKDDIDCFEIEQSVAGRALLEALSVTQVPTVQIFDGNGVSRLANMPCKPADFKAVETKVRECAESRHQERGGEMDGVRGKGERMLDLLLQDAGLAEP